MWVLGTVRVSLHAQWSQGMHTARTSHPHASVYVPSVRIARTSHQHARHGAEPARMSSRAQAGRPHTTLCTDCCHTLCPCHPGNRLAWTGPMCLRPARVAPCAPKPCTHGSRPTACRLGTATSGSAPPLMEEVFLLRFSCQEYFSPLSLLDFATWCESNGSEIL